MRTESVFPGISFAVLNGGKSRRMGKDKGGIRYKGASWLSRAVALLSQYQPVPLVSVHDIREVPGGKPVTDLIPGIGPAGGIYSLLKYVDTPKLLVIPVDMPFLTAGCLDALLSGCPDDSYLCTFSCEGHPCMLPGIYDKRLLPEMERMIAGGDYSLRSLFHREVTYRIIDGSNFRGELRNINTPEQWDGLR